jgi:N-acetylmuramoyl-L-alanine amidase
MKCRSLIYFLLLVFSTYFSISRDESQYVEFVAKKGDKLELIFKKFHIPTTKENFSEFVNLNKTKTNQKLKLMTGVKYKLPLVVISRNKLNTFLKDKVVEDSVNILKNEILNYNNLLKKTGIKANKKDIWIPLYLFTNYNFVDVSSSSLNNLEKSKSQHYDELSKRKSKDDWLTKPFYGRRVKVQKKSNQIKNFCFYLVSGHGGPDPGAIGYFDGKELDEDEYAYDITLRLAKHLEEHGAKVYMLVIDTLDGIRDEKFLEPSNREFFYGGAAIPLNQKERLELCASIVNKLYEKEKQSRKHHISINIHLDSRSEEEKVDVFFYYQENSQESKRIAETLQSTFAKQYEKYQPGRGYSGTVETRNLYMLKNTVPPTVYLELGNIKNRSNQFRFIDKNNREALAKWLCIGLINYSKAISTTLKQQK